MTRIVGSHTEPEFEPEFDRWRAPRPRRRRRGIPAVIAAATLLVATGLPLGVSTAGATTAVCGETDPLAKVVAATFINDTMLAGADPHTHTMGPSQCPTPAEATLWRAFLASGHPVSDFTYHMNMEYLTPFLVRLAYSGVFERQADPGGLAHWTTYLKKTGNFMGMIADMAASHEYTSYDATHHTLSEYIDAMYYLFTRHDADPGGMAFWTHYLTDGGSPGALTHSLIKRHDAGYPAVSAAFTYTLNRQPDQSSLDYWSTVLQHHHGNLLQIMALISNSGEYYNYCQNGFP